MPQGPAIAGTRSTLPSGLAITESCFSSEVDSQIGQAGTIFDQSAGIVLAPRRLIRPQIAAQRFLTPRAVDRADDWRKQVPQG